MRTKMPTGRYLHGAHGAPYFDKTLNLLALRLTLNLYLLPQSFFSTLYLISIVVVSNADISNNYAQSIVN